jgi:hypothetical protein
MGGQGNTLEAIDEARPLTKVTVTLILSWLDMGRISCILRIRAREKQDSNASKGTKATPDGEMWHTRN